MKSSNRDIKVFTKTIDSLKAEDILLLKRTTTKEVYDYNNLKKIKEEVVHNSTNIFQTYSSETYKVYKDIAKLLDEACKHYSIYKDRQDYFIKGKLFNYTESNNNEVFDFPGGDVPIFHGFVVLGSGGLEQTYYTNTKKERFRFSKNTVTLSAPTSRINTKVEGHCTAIEYYISPLSSILQNEQGLWVPIL
jgi:ethanolamine utilization protein EutA (predicted chaperonin)